MAPTNRWIRPKRPNLPNLPNLRLHLAAVDEAAEEGEQAEPPPVLGPVEHDEDAVSRPADLVDPHRHIHARIVREMARLPQPETVREVVRFMPNRRPTDTSVLVQQC